MENERTITAIEPQQKRKDRVSIFLDGSFALGAQAAVVESLHLGVGQRIGAERLAELVRREAEARAMDRALLLLSYRARAEREVRERLARAGYEPETVDAVVVRLYGLGYLDDREFAQRFISQRMEARPSGRRALAWELRRKGLDGEAVEAATAGLDDDTERASARRAAEGRLERIGSVEPPEARRRLAGFLQRRGFGWDTIRYVLDDVLPSGNGE